MNLIFCFVHEMILHSMVTVVDYTGSLLVILPKDMLHKFRVSFK